MGTSGKTHVSFPTVVDRAYEEYKRHRKVADIMSTGVAITTPQTSMADAARIMGERRIGSLVVVRYGTPVAIVTERDLLSNVFAAGRDPSDVLVEDVMSYPLIRICPDLEIREAARTMIRKKGRLTVFSCGELCGIITASDLIREMPEAKETSMNVNDFMTKDVVYVPEDEKISEVVRIMGTERIGSVLVTSNGNPTGIFTERDLLTTLLARGAALDIPVGDVARSPLITAPAGISIHKAAQIMAQNHIKRLPLVRRKRIAGIVTARDLVEAYAR